MNIVTTLTNYPNQRHELVLDNGDSADFHLYYHGRTLSWEYDITYKEKSINGIKVVLSPNALRQFRKVLPFGIAFYSNSAVEPFGLDDFSNGRVKMAVLNSGEVKQVEREVYNR